VHELLPLDALIVLMLQRCWGDRWGIKPADALDFRVLTGRGDIARPGLMARARELRCERTVSRFLSRCDPPAGVLELGLASRTARFRWSGAVFAERPTLLFEAGLVRSSRIPFVLLD